MSLLKLEDISYKYDGSDKYVLKNINLEFEPGKVYAITGKSGEGKTTLLSIMSALTSPTEGKLIYDDKDVKDIDTYEYRSKYVGIVFQSFNLLPQYTAKENVILSIDVSETKVDDKDRLALDMLAKVGIDEEKANRRILKLSGGEQQRVAIARTMSYNPDIIFADEPTGNLDNETEKEVIDIFKKLAHEDNKCVIIVTHSKNVSDNADVICKLSSANNK